MSSRFSPSIEVDCRPSRNARWGVPLALSGAALTPLLVGLGHISLLPYLTVLLALVVAVCLRAVGGSALRRAVMTSEGKWWLVDTEGRTLPGRLLPGSRVFAQGVWLRWGTPEGRRHALLLRRSAQGDAVRRLAGRLQLDGLPAPESPDSARS